MKHWTLAAAIVGGVSLFLAGCGGGPKGQLPCGSSPTAPSCPAPTIGITASTDLLKVKATFTFAATATHSDGTVVAVNQWASDNTQVASVEAASGKATGIGAGLATVIAEHDGARGTKMLRVVPDFQGRWEGDYGITACQESGDFVGFCSEFPVGLALPVSLQLSQPRETAQGAFNLGQLSASVSGTIANGGTLSLGDATTGVEGVIIKLTGTALTVDAGDQLQGTFRTVWTYPGAAGQALYDARLGTVRRVSATAGALAARRLVARTWRDVIPALVAR